MSDLPDSLPAAPTALYAKDSYVLLLPEYTFGVVPRVCYAKVTRVELGRMVVTTKRLVSHAAVTITLNTRLHRPVVVTKAEYTGGQPGVWLRKSVITLTTEEIFHGQVVAYAHRPPKLVVRTRIGDLDMRPDEVSEIPGPLGLILFHARMLTSSTSIEQAYTIHDEIMKRIKGVFPDTQPVLTRAAIFQGLIADPGTDLVD